jgi:hypothetical protein
MGVHPFGDARMTDDFAAVPVAIDAREPHDYAAEWTAERVRFFVDDRLVKVVEQSPAYPMQLMLNVYALSPRDGDEPLAFVVHHVRGWRPRLGVTRPPPAPPRRRSRTR